jgi:hypothetical protein
MDRKRLRIALVEKDKRLVDLHRTTGISYNRLVRLANGYTEPRDTEVALIASALGLNTTELIGSVSRVG